MSNGTSYSSCLPMVGFATIVNVQSGYDVNGSHASISITWDRANGTLTGAASYGGVVTIWAAYGFF